MVVRRKRSTNIVFSCLLWRAVVGWSGISEDFLGMAGGFWLAGSWFCHGGIGVLLTARCLGGCGMGWVLFGCRAVTGSDFLRHGWNDCRPGASGKGADLN